MSSRKTKNVSSSYRDQYGRWYTYVRPTEALYESARPGPCNCSHVKSSLLTCTTPTSTSFPDIRVNWPSALANFEIWHLIAANVSPALFALDWGKLPSSSEFSIINIIAELDDAIALFTLRFWERLSYGSLTWGVLPFVSDVAAILKTIKNVQAGLGSFKYESSNSADINKLSVAEDNCNKLIVSGSVTARHVGRCTVPESSQLQQWIDVLGFHPDIATAWDLVPLSFVVDYLIPIGSYLESFRTGWLTTVRFDGWSSVKYKVTADFLSTPPCYPKEHNNGLYHASRYDRWHTSELLPIAMQNNISFEIPTITEMFNILYIAKQFSNK